MSSSCDITTITRSSYLHIAIYHRLEDIFILNRDPGAYLPERKNELAYILNSQGDHQK